MTYCRTLRNKIIKLIWTLGLSPRQICDRNPDLAPSLSQTKRIIKRWVETGSVKTPCGGKRRRLGIIPQAQLNALILHLTTTAPWLYLDEMRDWLVARFGLGATYKLNCVRANLIRKGITHMTLTRVSLRMCPFERATFFNKISDLPAHYFVLLDETRKDPRTLHRTHGWGYKGQRASVRRYFHRKCSGYSALGVMTIDGMVASSIRDARGVCSSMFCTDLVKVVLPLLQAFPGKNSVVVLDNAAIHHDPNVRYIIESTGARVVYLHAYGYVDMPIEKAFSKVKSVCERERAMTRVSPRMALEFAMRSVTAEDAVGYFRSCGWPVEEIIPGIYS